MQSKAKSKKKPNAKIKIKHTIDEPKLNGDGFAAVAKILAQEIIK